MASGPFLIGASLSRYGARGVAGEPVWRRAQQLRAAIEARLGGRHADLFAIPQVDEIGDKIDWYAPFDGVARGWNDLSDAERRTLEGRVSELKPELERLVARLDSDGRGEGERAFGRLLREAMVAPGSEALFSVAGRPVFAFWGFTGDGESARYFMGMPPPASSIAVPAAAAASVAAAPVAAAATEPPPPPPPVTEPLRAAAFASTAPVAGPAWWKWMLVASFLLIVLAAAAWYVRPYLPQWAWDGRAGLPTADRPTAGPTATAAVDDSALRALKDREVQLAADLARLRDQFVDKRKDCGPGATGRVVPDTLPPSTRADGDIVVLPDGTRVRPDGVVVDDDGRPKLGPDGRPVVVDRDRMRTATAPTKPDAAKPDARRPDTAVPKPDTAKPPATKPDVAARPDTSKPDTSKPDTARPPATRSDVAKGKPPAGPARPPAMASADKPIEPVKVPPGKGVDFMAGTWRSNTDLTTQDGDDVVRPQYTFDKDGKGKTRIIQKNGVICEGPASAQRDDQGRLVIRESEPLKCTDGTSYAPSTVTCQTDSAGRSSCSGSSEGGPGYVVTLGR